MQWSIWNTTDTGKREFSVVIPLSVTYSHGFEPPEEENY